MKGKICSWRMQAVAWILAAVMIFSVMPSSVYAAAGDGSVSEEETGLVLGTTLTDNLTVKGRRKLFDVWARDSQGNTVQPTAVFDGEELIPTWQDNVKSSFTLDFEGKEEGKHEVILSMACEEGTKELTCTVNYEKAEEGEFIGYATVSVEAFTISQGYIIEPMLMPVFEGDNAAEAFAALIRESGYDLNYSGSLESGFYMQNIVGSNADRPQSATKPLVFENVALDPNMLAIRPELEDYFEPDGGTEGSLGEFDYGFMTGWMYCVNTVFPNVGGSDYYLSGGDVMRWQFTVAYGCEIGGSGALGGGMGDYYPVANKDALTTTLAYINSVPNSKELKSNPEIAAAIGKAKEVLTNVPIGQEEVDQANSALRALLGGEVTGITLDQAEITLENGNSAVLTPSVTYTGAPIEPIEWESSNLNVAAVKNGTVTAVGEGKATITAVCGGKSASCQVTVPGDPELCAFSLVNGTAAAAAEYAITPAFSAETKNYRIAIPDSATATAVYAKAALPEGMEGSITARYTTKSGSGTEKTVALTSGKATGTSLANFFASGSVAGNTLYIDVAAGEKTTTYQMDVVRETTLTSIQASAGSQKLILTPVFSNDIREYTVKMPNTVDQVNLEVSAKSSEAVISVNGTEAAEGKAAVEVKGDSAAAVIKAVAEGADAREYKVTFEKVPLVSVQVHLTPADAVLIVKDAEGTEILPENGAYALLSGAEYTLKATKNGYVGVSEKVRFSEDTVKDVALAATAPSTLKDLPAAWKNFRNSDVNMGITSAKTPKSTLTTYLKWSQKVGTGWGSNTAGSPIIVDDAIIIMQGSSLKKYDRKTGELLKSVDMDGAQDFGYTPPTYAAGMIFVPIHGKIQAFNAETLESLWVYKDELGGQALSPITYADGYVYTGFWNSETKDANYVCVSVADEDPEQELEEKLSTWEYTSAGGFYWAGAFVSGDSVIFGTDDGTSGSTGASRMLSMNRYTGRIQDSLELIGDQRSTVSYDEKTGRIWFTTKGGYLYSVILKADGTFDHDSMKSLQVGGASTSTPLVYNGRVYVGVTSGSNFDGKFGVNVIDAEAMSVIYSAELKGYPQCSVLLSNAYEAEDGTVYIYSTYNNNPGGISLIRDKKGQTTADIEEIFVPDAPQYCISSIICDEEGTLYYKNDSGYLFAVSSSSAYLMGASVDVEGAMIDGGAAFAGEKVSHEIVVPVSAENITLSLTASEGSEIFVNDEKGTSFQLPVGEETSTVAVKVVREKDERNYTFTIRKQSQDATLSDLKVGSSNGYNSFLTLTPAFDNETYEYRAEYTTTKSFLNLWLKASDPNAVIRVYPLTKVGNTEIDEDGTIPVTANNGSNLRRAIYFESGYDCSKVRVEVTAEDGVTTKTFYVSMKQKANNTPVISAGEDAAVHTDNEEGKLTFTSNEYGKAYYQFAEAGGEAPASIDTTGAGIDIEIGENTIDLTGLKKQGGIVYLVVKDTDATPHISNRISVPIAAYVGPEDGVIGQIGAISYDENGMPDAETVKQIRAAYDALTDVQKSRVTNYAKLLEAEKKLLEAESKNKDQAAAEAVMKAISAIGEVTSLDKKGEVAAVRAAYESLSEAQKVLVTNLSVLTGAEEQIVKLTAAAEEQAKKDEAEQKRQEELAQQAAPVIEAINAIGTVSLDSEAAIQAAKEAYEALSEEAKAKVGNYAKLVIAEKELEILKAEEASRNKDKAAAESVMRAISAIGEVTSLDKKGEVAAVRAAYESLSEAQKVLVTNLSVLTGAEEQIAKLTAEAEEQAKKDEAEQKRQEELAQQAAPVIEAINAIGTVSLDSEEAIRSAKEAYEALSEEAKAKVGNYAKLVIAEKEFEILKAEEASRNKDKAAAESVMRAVSAIGEVTSLDKRGEVAAVRAAYESLSEAQKALVMNLSVLSGAEAQIAKLTAEAEEQAKKDEEEQKRQEELSRQAAAVMEAINAIGTVSLDSEAAIRAAKEAYAALSEEAKAKVGNYAELVIAEKDLEIRKDEEKQKIREGQTYSVGDYSYQVTSNADMTVAVAGLENDSLKKLVIPDTVTLGNKQYKVTAIAASAFKNNKKITSVTIKKNLETIGANAFAGCKKLKTVKINSTKLKEIGSKVFCKCGKLTKITIKSKALKKVGKSAFKGTSAKLTIKVTAAKYQAYKKLLAKKGQNRNAQIKK